MRPHPCLFLRTLKACAGERRAPDPSQWRGRAVSIRAVSRSGEVPSVCDAAAVCDVRPPVCAIDNPYDAAVVRRSRLSGDQRGRPAAVGAGVGKPHANDSKPPKTSTSSRVQDHAESTMITLSEARMGVIDSLQPVEVMGGAAIRESGKHATKAACEFAFPGALREPAR
jgi:hypothetical protein